MRLLLVDDHWVVRAGLRLLAHQEADLTVVGEAASAHEAICQARDLRPDLTFLGLNLPDASGLDILPDLAEFTRVIVLSVHAERSWVVKALKRGARGYLRKDVPAEELLRAISVVRAGKIYVDPILAAEVLAPPRAAPASVLSPREEQVLNLVVLGYTNQEIAARMRIGVRTVETYKLRLCDKLQLHGRAELVRYGLEHGLLEA